MKGTLGLVAAAGAVLISAFQLPAHHAFTAEFDVKKPVKLRGIVARVEMVNPHSWIYIDVKNEDGTTTQWMLEAGSPNVLIRRGFTKTSLPKGTDVIFEGFQAKDGSNRANGRDITLPDGKKLFVGSTGTEGPPEETKKQ
ncbi:MAG TPA: DUF6152 family protein [Bryobacteraceae bacterium]|nr:DUF6152 family protein [Bryobacteraceae bacterium]